MKYSYNKTGNSSLNNAILTYPAAKAKLVFEAVMQCSFSPMTRLFRLGFVIIILFLFSKPGELNAQPLVVAISDFPPSIDLSDKNYGVHGELVLNALRTIEQPFEIKIYSWSRIQQMLDTENICSFGWVKNKKRQEKWQYSDPYISDISYLWGRKDNKLTLKTLEDSLKYRIGVTRGFSYGQRFDNLLSIIETDEGFDDTVNLRKLLAGRIDLFPAQAIIVEPILAARFTDQADELEPKIEINNLSHHFVCNINSQVGKNVIKKINPLFSNIDNTETVTSSSNP